MFEGDMYMLFDSIIAWLGIGCTNTAQRTLSDIKKIKEMRNVT